MVRLHPRTQLNRVKTQTKAMLNVWPLGKSLAYAVDDLGWGVRQRLGRIESESGSTHRAVAIEDSVTYVEEVFNDYLTYGGLDHVAGTVAEVGPGDNAGVALLLQWAGCETVDLVDRFRSRRNPDQQKLIYRALADRHHSGSLAGSWDDERFPGITWRLGASAEDFFARHVQEGRPGYDLIVSRATLEHLYDPLGAIRSMAACLKQGGRMVHKVDFRDHGMFTPAHPELTFLRFPTVLYREMTRRSGRPNRVLLHRYRDLAEELGRSGRLQVTILVTSLVGQGEVTPHVPFAALAPGPLRRAVTEVESEQYRFAREFADVAPEDLAVSGIFWIGTRPG